MQKPIILVDTFGYFFRSYYALPRLSNSSNFPTSLLAGFSNFMLNLYKEHPDTCIIFALEGEGSIRKQIYPDYKANRREAPADLLSQLPIAIGWLEKMNVPRIAIDGYEADDCLASLASLANAEGLEVKIISKDKDLYQLINPKTSLIDYNDYACKKKITARHCVKKFGIEPKDFITYQSIVGDSSDNIPGIKGIGPKGAIQILENFKSLEELYGALDSSEDGLIGLLSKRSVGLIKEGRELAYISRELVSLKRDLLASYDFSAALNTQNHQPLLHIKDELEKYEIDRVLTRIGGFTITKKTESKISLDFSHNTLSTLDSIKAILSAVPQSAPIAFDCETNGLDPRVNKIVGFSFCIDGSRGYYVPLLHREALASGASPSLWEEESENKSSRQVHNQLSLEESKEALGLIFSHPLIGHNIKFDLNMVLHNFGIYPKAGVMDSMVLAWLISVGGSLSLDNLMLHYFGYKMLAFDEVVPKDKTFDYVDIQIATKYASEDAIATHRLYNKLVSVCPKEVFKLASEVEFPLILTLFSMEAAGLSLRRAHFLDLEEEFKTKLQELQAIIYKESGQEFNIRSPKQVAKVLFEDLGLDSKDKNLSTNESILHDLQGQHPVISPLLQYRELFKLLSSYVEPLLSRSEKTPRIYTSFIHTGTSTGRLSSKNPNMQNIAVRSDLGRRIRAGFEAPAGFKLVSLDYSQIELRLLAHFSRDPMLLESFRKGEDIHTRTAITLFEDFDSCDSKRQAEFRRIAKGVNFGLIYGMGARKLSLTLGIDLADAKEYINRYFAHFPTVKTYLDGQKSKILKRGYSATLLGRRRYFDFLGLNEFDAYLREGVNAIFQGSAADLIKLSMNAILQSDFGALLDSNGRFDSKESSLPPSFPYGNEARLLLQVHDELVFEIQEELALDRANRIKLLMEGIYPLRVPLVCNLSVGASWDALK